MARLNYKEVLKGDVGYTFEPHVTVDGVLYWSNNGDLPNPLPVNIKGKQGEKGEKGEEGDLKETDRLKIDKVINDYDKAIANLTNGNESATNSEIVQARNGEVNLNSRLDKFDSQLSENEKLLNYTRIPVQSKKVFINWIDDDGCLNALNLANIMKEYEFRCSFAINTGFVGQENKLSWEQIKQLQNDGFEIVSHGHQHAELSDDKTDEYMINELKKSYDALVEHDLTSGCNIIAYGNGVSCERSRNIAKNWYDMGFKWAGEKVYNNALPTMNMGRYFVVDSRIDEIKSKIDSMVDGSVLTIGSHSGMSEFKESNVRTILSYIKSKGYKICSTNEIIKERGNTLTTGDRDSTWFDVGNDGSIDTSLVTFDELISLATLPKDLKLKSIKVISRFTDNDAPSSEKKGVLISVNPNTKNNIFQLWRPYDTNELYFRSQNGWQGTSWKNWVCISGGNPIITGYSANTLLNVFPANQVTMVKLSDAEVSGLPTSKGGLLITYSCGEYHSYQEFKCWAEGNVKYIRSWNKNTSKWGVWFKNVYVSV